MDDSVIRVPYSLLKRPLRPLCQKGILSAQGCQHQRDQTSRYTQARNENTYYPADEAAFLLTHPLFQPDQIGLSGKLGPVWQVCSDYLGCASDISASCNSS